MEKNIFVKLITSPNKQKKFRMNFYVKDNDEVKKILHQDFGSSNYSDYTKHKDEKRKENYLKRHKPNENWNKFYTAGALSRWILWNKETIEESFKDYVERFDLKVLP